MKTDPTTGRVLGDRWTVAITLGDHATIQDVQNAAMYLGDRAGVA